MSLNRIQTENNRSNNDNTESNYTRLGSGEYEGRLVYIGDLGLQERNFKGEEKPPCQQICLGLEIIGSDNNGEPRFLWSRPFNIFSKMSDLSVEYKMYKVFNPNAKPDTVADWDAVMGEPCMVHVVATKSRDGTAEYDNVGDITPIPAKFKAGIGAARITPCIGDSNDESNPATQALYGLAKFIFDKKLDAPVKKNSGKQAKKSEEKVAIDITEDAPY